MRFIQLRARLRPLSISQRPHRLNEREREELEGQLSDLLAKGHITPSCSPYGAPVFLVPKKNGMPSRVVIDWRKLNNIAINNKVLPPPIYDLLDLNWVRRVARPPLRVQPGAPSRPEQREDSISHTGR